MHALDLENGYKVKMYTAIEVLQKFQTSHKKEEIGSSPQRSSPDEQLSDCLYLRTPHMMLLPDEHL